MSQVRYFWWVDGHQIVARNVYEAREAVKELYNHDAKEVRAWTPEDNK